MKKILFYAFIFLIGFSLKTDQDIISRPHHYDGFGSQFFSIIAAVIYAELTNKMFVYTPFEKMEHNYNNAPDFLQKKETLINFIDNFPLYDPNKHHINHLYFKDTCYFKKFFELNISQCAQSQALKKIKKIFRANKNRDRYFNSNYINIAIHIRRPNPHDDRLLGADTPNKVFLKAIKKLRKLSKISPMKIHIYSQGNLDDFKKIYRGKYIEFHINESIEDSFTAMVLADVLVISPSCFSYTAGLLSEGTVFYVPLFGCQPLPHWKPIRALKKKHKIYRLVSLGQSKL